MSLLKQVMAEMFLNNDVEKSFEKIGIDISSLSREEKGEILYKIKSTLINENLTDEQCYVEIEKFVNEVEQKISKRKNEDK